MRPAGGRGGRACGLLRPPHFREWWQRFEDLEEEEQQQPAACPRQVHCQQRHAALAKATELAGQAAAGEHRAVAAETQLDMAETEVNRLEGVIVRNSAMVARNDAAANRRVDKHFAFFVQSDVQ